VQRVSKNRPGGAVTHQHTTTTKNGNSQPTSDTVNSFVWWDQALTNVTSFTPDVSQPSTVWTTTYGYNARGMLISANIQDGRPRTVTFLNNNEGQIMLRKEHDNNSSLGDPIESHYYFDNQGLGVISNNGPGTDVNYTTSITDNTKKPGTGPFAYGSNTGTSFADADASYDPINGLDVNYDSSQYTVEAGDTLAGIAQKLWGDSSFWYLIADANGLSSADTLVEGQTLIIPNKVTNAHNNSSTYQVFNPNQLIGDTSPTAPKPPKPHHGGGCGVLGMIFLAVIAIVVTVVSFGVGALAVTGASTLFGATGALATISTVDAIAVGAVAGAVGSLVSQGVGLATGLQSKLDWGAVGLSAISSAVTAGIGANAGAFASIGDAVGGGTLGDFATGAAIGVPCQILIRVIFVRNDDAILRGQAAKRSRPLFRSDGHSACPYPMRDVYGCCYSNLHIL